MKRSRKPVTHFEQYNGFNWIGGVEGVETYKPLCMSYEPFDVLYSDKPTCKRCLSILNGQTRRLNKQLKVTQYGNGSYEP